ncbi:hypothetical protein [Roseivirga misakiensis]|uniref:Translocation protein TolB n=1 Tax=Roseivirga misakiensis TaxID=1563681 RepID=A0A1E5T277_9BACT|nr:hypothetical protein [Roseivirga misakiensis]OEK05482.1 hypothetical protein BFP71_19055 [Roseivirga misakiensis]
MSRTSLKSLAAFAFIACLFSTNVVHSQAEYQTFGKNRIQYKNFDWKYYSSKNFEVYFYGRSGDLAKNTIEYLESEFSRITEVIGYFPFAKTRVFLYNSVADRQQSNVGIKGRDFTIGGQTNFIKSQLELAYTGDYASFKKKAVFSVTDMLIQEMLYGGNIAEMFQTSFTTPIPVWFTAGISSFVSAGWNKESDDAARDFLANNRQNKFVKLGPEMNVLLGQSIWNFITQRYGLRSISNVLNLARILRDEETSIERTLGVPYSQFLNEWRAFYTGIGTQIAQTNDSPNPDFIITGRNRKDATFTDIEFSPSGDHFAYASLDNGRFEVQVVDTKNQRISTLHKAGVKLINQEIDNQLPLLSWVDANTLGVVYSENGENILLAKRLGEKGEQRVVIPLLSNVQSFEFKEGGRVAIMTGDINGVSNVFVYNLVRGQIQRVTDDNFDERDATFIKGTNQIVFSSNRNTDSVFVSGPATLAEAEGNQFNLFTYDLDFPDSSFNKLTNVLATNLEAYAPNNVDVYYLSDQQGINNLYRHNITDTISTQISNFALGVKDYSFDPNNQRLAFVSITDGKESVFYQSFEGVNSRFSPVTPRRALEVSKILADRRNDKIVSNPAILDSLTTRLSAPAVKPPEQKLDSLKEGAINTENYEFASESKVDTRDYQFEKPQEDPTVSGRSFLSVYQNSEAEKGVQGPFLYENRIQTNNLVTGFMIDQIRGFALQLQIEMNDYLENHRFSAGTVIPTSLNRGYDVFAEYKYLKERIDLSARYSRKSIVALDRQAFLDQRYNLDKIELGFSYPLSQTTRVSATPFYARTQFIDRDFRLLIPITAVNPQRFNEDANQTASFLGLSGEIVYDRSVVVGTNLHEGTRARLSMDLYGGLSADARGFNNVELDIRHYQKINKGLYLAAKFYYGSFFGDAPKRFFLGGVDNWLLNRTQVGDPLTDDLSFQPLFNSVINNTGVDPNKSAILFNRFANLRGYDYNTFQGSNVLTFSAEIRFPINQLLQNSQIKNNFVRNLQIVGFYDIGSAWDDLSPFEDRNNQNIEEISTDGSPFSAIINNFNNPWLQSTGVGVRSMLFGYYGKLEMSFPIQNFAIQNPRFQISIGYDF